MWPKESCEAQGKLCDPEPQACPTQKRKSFHKLPTVCPGCEGAKGRAGSLRSRTPLPVSPGHGGGNGGGRGPAGVVSEGR